MCVLVIRLCHFLPFVHIPVATWKVILHIIVDLSHPEQTMTTATVFTTDIVSLRSMMALFFY